MKKLITILLMLVLTSITNAQWVKLTNAPKSWESYLEVKNGVLYDASWGHGVYKSTNNGITWTSYNSGITDSSSQCLYFSGDTTLLGTETGGVFKSTNYGINWVAYSNNLGNNKNIFSITRCFNKFFIGTTSITMNTNELNYSYNTPPILNGWVSDYTWESYSPFNGVPPHINSFYPTDSVLYICTSTGYGEYRTNPVQIEYSWSSPIVSTMVLGPENKIRGNYTYGIEKKTTNNGGIWTITLPIGVRSNFVRDSLNYLYVGTVQGFYYSTDNGWNWTQKNTGMPTIRDINSLILSNGYFYAARPDSSIWRCSRTSILTDISNNTTDVKDYHLSQNYPNPWNPSTTITYSIPKSGLVTLKVFNIQGKEITTLVNENQSPGTYSVDFQEAELPSGI
jgi:hypothetical protein